MFLEQRDMNHVELTTNFVAGLEDKVIQEDQNSISQLKMI